ncbi:hypothetical protein VTK73DRAFT_2449 [Phialemonium thermophilum]|uniref:Uncharacterized protein n=1 Tax=Phialemonium thermophilum TaxID=223376 RepID=A0ABR3VS30_9PEZI
MVPPSPVPTWCMRLSSCSRLCCDKREWDECWQAPAVEGKARHELTDRARGGPCPLGAGFPIRTPSACLLGPWSESRRRGWANVPARYPAQNRAGPCWGRPTRKQRSACPPTTPTNDAKVFRHSLVLVLRKALWLWRVRPWDRILLCFLPFLRIALTGPEVLVACEGPFFVRVSPTNDGHAVAETGGDPSPFSHGAF